MLRRDFIKNLSFLPFLSFLKINKPEDKESIAAKITEELQKIQSQEYYWSEWCDIPFNGCSIIKLLHKTVDIPIEGTNQFIHLQLKPCKARLLIPVEYTFGGIYDDPCLYKNNQRGIYGWIEKDGKCFAFAQLLAE